MSKGAGVNAGVGRAGLGGNIVGTTNATPEAATRAPQKTAGGRDGKESRYATGPA